MFLYPCLWRLASSQATPYTMRIYSRVAIQKCSQVLVVLLEAVRVGSVNTELPVMDSMPAWQLRIARSGCPDG